jgi:CheY-like chemotaxis protein
VRVLIVEADADVLQIVTELLAEDGFEVAGRTEPRDALAALDERRPDALLLDLGDHPSATARFLEQLASRPRSAELPVVLVGGSPADARAPAVVHVLSKPFSIAEVEAALLATACARAAGVATRTGPAQR